MQTKTLELGSYAGLKKFAATNTIRTSEKMIPGSSRVDYSFAAGFLWYLVQGRCIVTRTTYQGQELALGNFRQPPELLVVSALLLAGLDSTNPQQAVGCNDSVQILTPTKECALLEGFYFADILAVLSQARFSPDLLSHFFLSLSNQINASLNLKSEQVVLHATKGLHHRIARVLLDLAADSHEIRISHYELAILLSTYREVTTELLTDLKVMGIVQTTRGRIIILDRERLQGVVDGSVAVLSRKKRLKANL